MTDKIGDNTEVDEGIAIGVAGHLLIRDPNTGETLLNQRDNLSQQAKRGEINAVQ